MSTVLGRKAVRRAAWRRGSLMCATHKLARALRTRYLVGIALPLHLSEGGARLYERCLALRQIGGHRRHHHRRHVNGACDGAGQIGHLNSETFCAFCRCELGAAIGEQFGGAVAQDSVEGAGDETACGATRGARAGVGGLRQ